jgi:hypothetical protein
MADAGFLELEKGAEPSTPATGFKRTFVDSVDGHLKVKDDAGSVVDLEASSAPVSSVFGRTGAVVAAANDYSAAQVQNTPAGNISAATVQAAINELDTEKAPASHVGAGGVSEHAIATGAAAGFMSPSDFTKLSGVAVGATANDTDANLKNRANHTGTQLAGTISDFAAAADARAAITSTPAAHVGSGGSQHAQATTSVDGFMSAGDKTKLDGVAAGATANDTDANLRNRATHTGTQLHTTISDFHSAARDSVVDNAIVDGVNNRAPSQNAVFDALALKLVDPMTTNGDLITRVAGVAARLGIGAEGALLRSVSGAPTWEEENLTQDFGDESDGNLTVSGALTLTQIPFYNVLTIEAGAAINTNGFPIYCKVLDLTNAPAGSIQRNGNNGTNTAGNTGGAGGSSLSAAVLGGSGGGSTGAAGSTTAGSSSVTPATINTSNGGNGGNSGASGAGGTGAAAPSGNGGNVTSLTHFGRFEYQFLRGATIVSGGAGGRGGNSGGGNGTNSSRGGGGGGGGAGILVIYAAEIITGPSTPAGVITANGGNGGVQTNTPAGGDVGGAGGSGGGGGGYCYIAYVKKTGSAVSGLVTANGGTGGSGSNGLGTGLGGNGGNGGNGGYIQAYNVSDNTGTQVTGAAGSAGTAASGITGGAGGNGGVCQLSL